MAFGPWSFKKRDPPPVRVSCILVGQRLIRYPPRGTQSPALQTPAALRGVDALLPPGPSESLRLGSLHPSTSAIFDITITKLDLPSPFYGALMGAISFNIRNTGWGSHSRPFILIRVVFRTSLIRRDYTQKSVHPVYPTSNIPSIISLAYVFQNNIFLGTLSTLT